MKGITEKICCVVVAVLVFLTVGVRAETISLNHSIENNNAVVRATRKNRVSAVSVGVEAEYTDEYLVKLKSGRKWPGFRRLYEQPESYDLTSKIMLHPSREIRVTHTNDLFMDNHLRETTKVVHQSNLFETDVNSAIIMSYDSLLDTTIFETSSTLYGSFADLGYTTKNGEPTAVFVSESFAPALGHVQMQYIPTVKYDLEDNGHYFSNIINAETRLSFVDVELGAKELFTKKGGSFHTRKFNISYGYTSFGIVSREMEQELWRNGHTFFWKDRLDLGNGSPDFSVKTSYTLATTSDEKKIYVELIWGLKDGLFQWP